MTDPATPTSAVRIDTLTLRRIAGIQPDQAFTLSDLPPGLILLYGPNGSGKSTTARAIQELLWPASGTSTYQELHAKVTQGSEQWELDRHGTSVTALQGSQPVPHPGWAPSELRGRYAWSLNGLLRAEDTDLAATLAAEMAGGIDFPALAERLGWDKVPSAPQKKARELKDAERGIRAITTKLEDLRRQATTLNTLTKQREAAVRQRDRHPLVQAAMDLLDKQQELAELVQSLEGYSKGAKQVQPGDANRLTQALARQEQCRLDLRDLERDRAHTASANPFLEVTLSDGELESIRQELEQTEHQWRDASRERHQAEEDLASAEQAETRLRNRLGVTDPTSVDLEGYDLPDLRNWVEAVLEAEESALRLRAAEQEFALHPDHPPIDPDLVQELRLDVRRLREHLEGTTRKGTLPFWITLLTLAGVLYPQIQAGLMPVEWMLLLPALTLTPLLWELVRKQLLAKELEHRLPDELKLAEVTPSTVRSLQSKLDQLDREPELRRRFEEAGHSHQQNTRILEALEERVTALGIQPVPSREWCRNFLEDLQTWRKATDQVAQAGVRLAEREKRLDTLLETFRNAWTRMGIAPSHEDPVVESIELRNRIAKTLSARQHLRHVEQQEKDLRTRAEEAENDIAALQSRLGLQEPNPALVEELEREHTRWEETFRTSEAVRQRVSELRKLISDKDTELLNLERPALASLETDCRDASIREEELRDQITRLTQQIELAQEGRDLHQAREERDAARADLLDERIRMAQQVAGRALLDWLQESCRIGEQPEALQEANRLLTVFTQGQLELSLDLTPEGHVFHGARPGESPRELRDLSTGERTQVLMAVRLAFLKRNERAPLPLLVDEVLGTSDDARAEAIMQTLLQVAREGRQIFYFTAQTDEVAKWKRELERAADVPHALIDLHALRTATPPQPIQLPVSPPSSAAEMSRRPGESRKDWAKRLGVPAWDGHDPIETLPLFMLMGDQEEALTRCLALGLRTWGPLENLIERHPAAAPVSDELATTLKAKAAAFTALAAAWRIGRPPAIDPAVVMNSGIVTENFADEVLRVLKETSHNAARFLDALENKAINRWRQDNTDQLRALFYDQGWLTDEPPLNEEQMMSHALAGMKGKAEMLSEEEWANAAQTLLSAISGGGA